MKKTNKTGLYLFKDDEELMRFREFAYKRSFHIRSHFPAPHLVADITDRKEEEAGYQMMMWHKQYLLVKKDSRLESAVRDFIRESR
jgi:hypothetical protein